MKLSQETLIDNLLSGGPINPQEYDGRMSHRYSVLDTDDNVITSNVGHADATYVRDEFRKMFGGSYKIIETETLTRGGDELFSGEKKDILPHVSSHVPMIAPIDPNQIVWYESDVAGWITELLEERGDIAHVSPVPAFLNPIPRRKIAPVKRSAPTKVVERRYSGDGVSSGTPWSRWYAKRILRDRGYSLIDTRDARILYSGTKGSVLAYIKNQSDKSVPLRDRLSLDDIKIIRYRDYADYVIGLKESGYIAYHVSQGTIIRGNKADVAARVAKYIKSHKLSDAEKYIKIERIA